MSEQCRASVSSTSARASTTLEPAQHWRTKRRWFAPGLQERRWHNGQQRHGPVASCYGGAGRGLVAFGLPCLCFPACHTLLITAESENHDCSRSMRTALHVPNHLRGQRAPRCRLPHGRQPPSIQGACSRIQALVAPPLPAPRPACDSDNAFISVAGAQHPCLQRLLPSRQAGHAERSSSVRGCPDQDVCHVSPHAN